MDYIICNLSYDDLSEIKRLYESVFSIECNLQKMENNFLKVKDNSRIIKVKNKIIAHIKWDIIYNVFGDSKPYMYISEVCVDKNYRNMGYGKILLNDVENIAKQNDCSYIFLNSSNDKTSAHSLYKTCGYYIRNSSIFKKEL